MGQAHHFEIAKDPVSDSLTRSLTEWCQVGRDLRSLSHLSCCSKQDQLLWDRTSLRALVSTAALLLWVGASWWEGLTVGGRVEVDLHFLLSLMLLWLGSFEEMLLRDGCFKMTKSRHLLLLWLVSVCSFCAAPLYSAFHLLWSVRREDCYVLVQLLPVHIRVLYITPSMAPCKVWDHKLFPRASMGQLIWF